MTKRSTSGSISSKIKKVVARLTSKFWTRTASTAVDVYSSKMLHSTLTLRDSEWAEYGRTVFFSGNSPD